MEDLTTSDMKITKNADGTYSVNLKPYEFAELSAAMGYCQCPDNGKTSPYARFAADFARAERNCEDNKIIEKYNLIKK